MKKAVLLLWVITMSAGLQAQWQSIYSDPSMGAMQTLALNKDTVFVSRNWNQLLKTADGGVTWDTITHFNSYEYRMHFIDQQHGFMSGSAAFPTGATFFKTADCGITWQPMSFFASAPGFTTDVHFLNKDTGFVTDGSIVAKTTDGGISFQTLTLGSGNYKINDLHFINHSVGFAAVMFDGGFGGGLYLANQIFKTTDQGATWTLVHSDTDMGNNSFVFAGIVEIFFVNDTFGVAMGGEGKMLKTRDGGATWTNVANSFNDFNITDVQFLTEQKGYICYAGKMYYTQDGMSTWKILQDSTFDYYSVSMLNENLGYAAGHGIFKTQNGGGITSVFSTPNVGPSIRIYPNPASEWLIVEPASGVAVQEIAFADISGKKVRTYSSALMPLDIKGLTEGIYFLQITTTEGIKIEKVLIE